MRKEPSISVVIPAWNEAKKIGPCLEQFRLQAGAWDLIVADGGSADGTAELAEELGAKAVRCPVRGRGPQQNAGAEVARGEILLFLHADATLPEDAYRWITATLMEPGTVAGAFRVRHEPELWRGWRAALLGLADLRSRWTRLPYGDQGLFLRRPTFQALSGFPPKSLMEDIAIARTLHRQGKIRTVRAEIKVSGRRFERGLLRAFLCMMSFPWLDRLGFSPHTLLRLYGNPR